jgi:transcriptional regulator with GAF, ATPase, and Fis domain
MSADPAPPELYLTVPGATEPVRVALSRALTTVGSSPAADVRLGGVPAQWLVVQQTGDTTLLCVLGTGARRPLRDGESTAVDGVTISRARPRPGDDGGIPVGQIADALAHVDLPGDALRLLLERVMRATEADSGAIITREGGGYTVAVTMDATGRPLPDGASLLSDTIVQQVLGSGELLQVDDLPGDDRYARVPSVVNLHLNAVLAVPMVLGDRVLGAIYLGKRDFTRPFSTRRAADLTVIASMSIPFLIQLRRATNRVEPAREGLLGESGPMLEVRSLVARVGPSDLSVLITGETGTGKEVAARAIHGASPRAARPMVALNCAAVPAGLFEGELFGYRKGAFTGALADRAGRVEDAEGSTLFLDEVGDMPLPLQAALLRVLQEREVTRLGENQPRAVDFRLVAATNRDLDAEVAAGRFREDLLFRLREVTITLPPLAARGDDIILLARLFLRQAEHQLSIAPHALAPEADRALRGYRWPGNVRELRATMRRAAVLGDGPVIGERDLGLSPRASGQAAAELEALGTLELPLAEARDAFVTRYIVAVIAKHGGNREAAAAALGISLRSLYRHL